MTEPTEKGRCKLCSQLSPIVRGTIGGEFGLSPEERVPNLPGVLQPNPLVSLEPTERAGLCLAHTARRGARSQKAHSPVYGRCARDKMHSKRAKPENKACSSKQQDWFVV